jgi:hypothetical protein
MIRLEIGQKIESRVIFYDEFYMSDVTYLGILYKLKTSFVGYQSQIIHTYQGHVFQLDTSYNIVNYKDPTDASFIYTYPNDAHYADNEVIKKFQEYLKHLPSRMKLEAV